MQLLAAELGAFKDWKELMEDELTKDFWIGKSPLDPTIAVASSGQASITLAHTFVCLKL